MARGLASSDETRQTGEHSADQVQRELDGMLKEAEARPTTGQGAILSATRKGRETISACQLHNRWRGLCGTRSALTLRYHLEITGRAGDETFGALNGIAQPLDQILAVATAGRRSLRSSRPRVGDERLPETTRPPRRRPFRGRG